ncbi:hypothetical protein NDA16_002272 [Ustilago loliicola]|nr:hypothetical protein NDA16_002272 [Ustilago loliicola]
MVKLTLSFALLGLGLATAASAAAVLNNVKTKEQLHAALNSWVPETYGSVSDTQWGVCKKDSKVCDYGHYICNIGSPDCQQINEEKKRELIDIYTKIYFAILSTGKCEHTKENGEWCNKDGFCNRFDAQDDPSQDCSEISIYKIYKYIEAIARSLLVCPDGSYRLGYLNPPRAPN